MKWLCAGRELNCETPLIMGIVNVTPDSFSDGGEHYSCDKAVEHGLKLLEQGADILDIGGESTRPGAPEVPVEEELARVIPVVEQLSKTGAILSVDTSKPQVILCAAQAGAHIINDVRALQWPGALDAAASTNLGVCLMHMRGTPKNMQSQTQYADVVEEVESFLLSRAQAVQQAGIRSERICLDYGFGFGKTLEHNYELMNRLERLKILELPVLVGVSRKSMVYKLLDITPDESLNGTSVLHTIALLKGASILRVHDVRACREVVRIVEKMLG